MNVSYRPRLAAVVAVATIALAACGTPTPGAAAVVGDSRVSEADLTTQVQAVLAAQGKALDSTDPELTSSTLDRLVKAELVDLLAHEAGITITQGQIDAELQAYATQAGGQSEVERIFLEQGIAPSQIPAVVVLNLQANALGAALAPSADQQAQGQALVQAITILSQAIKTEVSPRYGTWDAASLQVGAVPDDLSVPAAP